MIKRFDKENSFLSNFYSLYNPIVYNNITYTTSEHFFQAMKSIDVDDHINIALCKFPAQAKKLGRKIELREHWLNIKDTVMAMAIDLKFSANEDIRHKLLLTGNTVLVEGNYWHDNYWGNCMCDKCKNIPGNNQLGNILMTYRNNQLRKTFNN